MRKNHWKTFCMVLIGFSLLLTGCGGDAPSGSWVLDEEITAQKHHSADISGCKKAYEFEGSNQVKVYDRSLDQYKQVKYKKVDLPVDVPLADIKYNIRFTNVWEEVEIIQTNNELEMAMMSLPDDLKCYYRPWNK